MSNRKAFVTLTPIAFSLNAASAAASAAAAPPVPEPNSLLLFAVGGIAAVVAIRLTRRK